MKKSSLSCFVLILTLMVPVSPASALVQMVGTAQSTIKDIKLSESVKITENGESLKRVTQGLRQKKVVLAWFSVYVAQFFSGRPIETKSIESLKSSLLKGLPVVVTMTFVRDVDVGKIADGFRDVLRENRVMIENAPFKGFLEAVQKSGDVKDRQVYSFVFSEEKGKEVFRFQTDGREYYAVQDQTAGTLAQFMNIWLGKPIDSGLEQLQEQILKP